MRMDLLDLALAKALVCFHLDKFWDPVNIVQAHYYLKIPFHENKTKKLVKGFQRLGGVPLRL